MTKLLIDATDAQAVLNVLAAHTDVGRAMSVLMGLQPAPEAEVPEQPPADEPKPG